MKNKKYDLKDAKEFFESRYLYTMSPFKLKKLIENDIENINIIDVREYEDYIDGHIPFASHIPFRQIEEHLNMLKKDKLNIVYCYNPYCNLAYKAAYTITKEEYPVSVLLGGMAIWEKYGYDVIKTSEN